MTHAGDLRPGDLVMDRHNPAHGIGTVESVTLARNWVAVNVWFPDAPAPFYDDSGTHPTPTGITVFHSKLAAHADSYTKFEDRRDGDA